MRRNGGHGRVKMPRGVAHRFHRGSEHRAPGVFTLLKAEPASKQISDPAGMRVANLLVGYVWVAPLA